MSFRWISYLINTILVDLNPAGTKLVSILPYLSFDCDILVDVVLYFWCGLCQLVDVECCHFWWYMVIWCMLYMVIWWYMLYVVIWWYMLYMVIWCQMMDVFFCQIWFVFRNLVVLNRDIYWAEMCMGFAWNVCGWVVMYLYGLKHLANLRLSLNSAW
jgi:hypothetical protein